jgi:Tfp pilus assembly protein PilO
MRPESEVKFAQYTKWPFAISFAVSGYHDLGRFVSKMESSNDIFIIENITVRRDSTGKDLAVNLGLSYVAFNKYE